MNEAAANALIEAAMKGVRQIKGYPWDADGGRCAVGVIDEVTRDPLERSLLRPVTKCPECGAVRTWTGGDNESEGFSIPISNERSLIVHLNNDHGWGFLDIARKLGPSS